MGDRRGAETGLVGEDAAGKALLHGHHDGVAEDAAADALEGEGTGKDLAEDRGDVADAHDDNHDAGQDVENRHEGHQERGDLADALDAAEGNEGDDHGDQDAGDQRGDAEEIAQSTGDLTALGDVADAEGGKAAQEAEDNRHPAPVLADAVFDVVHRAAVVDAIFVLDAVLHGQNDLGILGDHAEEGCHPHPEDRAGAARKDGARDTGDVAGADRAGEGRRHGLKGRDVRAVVLRFFFLKQGADRVFQDPAEVRHLQPVDADRQIDAGPHQQQKHQGAPCEAVDSGVDSLDL